MKFFIALTYLVFTWMIPFQNIPFAELEHAVTVANVNTIVANGADKILVSVSNKESIYSKSQASMVLRDFFTKNKPVSFRITAKSQKSNDVSFVAGDYVAKTGRFRISFQLKLIGDDFRIDRIVITEL